LPAGKALGLLEDDFAVAPGQNYLLIRVISLHPFNLVFSTGC
jgi:hypothetical protein